MSAEDVTTDGGSGPRGLAWLALLGVLLTTAAVHWRALSGEFVYDDRELILANPLVTDVTNVPALFTRGHWDFMGEDTAQFIGHWRPLAATAHALAWAAGDGAPRAFHVASLLLHLGAIVAAFLLVRRLTASAWAAACAALLFALHPVQVESVAWASALNDPLFGCLALFSLERFLAWRARGSRGVPLASALCLGLALLAKEPAVAILPVILLLDALRVGRRDDVQAGRPLLSAPGTPGRAYGTLGAVLALWIVARMVVFESPWAGLDRQNTDLGVDALRMAQLRVEVLGGGLELLAVPVRLAAFRPFRPDIAPLDQALVRAALFAAVFLALTVALVRGRRRTALAAAGVVGAFLAVLVVPVESLGAFPLSDRYLYLPALGWALGATLFLAAALPRRVAGAAVFAIAALYAVRTVTRIPAWHDEETFYRVAAAQAPRSPHVLRGLGHALLDRYNAEREPEVLVEAAATFERAAELLEESRKPPTDIMSTSEEFLQVNLGLAWCSILAQDHSAARLMLEELVRRIEEIRAQEAAAREAGVRVLSRILEPERVWVALATAQYGADDFAAAETSFQRALELRPDAPETLAAYGRMLVEQGRVQEAAARLEQASALNPGDPELRLMLAQALQTLGDDARADALARELLETLPGRAEPLLVLATGALRREESAEALSWIERALRLEPDNALAWYQRARALLMRDEARDALSAFRSAVDLDPSGFEAHYDLGAYLLSVGALLEAQPYLVRAYALAPERHRKALADTLIRLDLEPDQWRELARVDAARGERNAALTWLGRVLESAPGDSAALLQRARLLRALGRDLEARAAFDEGARSAPDDYEAWSEYGLYLDELGDPDAAREVIRRALELPPPASVPAELHERSRRRLRERLDELEADPAPGPG